MADGQPPASDPPAALASVYSEVCANHRAIADFRAKLLALLPTVSGAAIFVLLAREDTRELPLAALGLFGFAVTFGLFLYDLRGIQDCIELRRRAQEIEAIGGVQREELSLFRGWPSPRVAGLADEVGAGWVVYTAVLGSWLYLAGSSTAWEEELGLLLVGLYVLLLIGFMRWFGPRIRGAGQARSPGATGARRREHTAPAGQARSPRPKHTPPVGQGHSTGAAGARGWEHTALAVADLEGAVEFYRAAFAYDKVLADEDGMSEQMASMVGVRPLECHLVQLSSSISEHVLELVEFRNMPRGSEACGPTRPGSGHLSFVVGDLDAALAGVERLGGRALGKITLFPNGRRVYCRDPSGSTTIELAELGRH